MSLLNDMLKDLEERKPKEIKIAGSHLDIVGGRNIHFGLRLISVIVITATLTALTFHFFKPAAMQKIVTQDESTTKSKDIPAEMTQVKAEPIPNSNVNQDVKAIQTKPVETNAVIPKQQETQVLQSQIPTAQTSTHSMAETEQLINASINKVLAAPSIEELQENKYKQAMEFANQGDWAKAIDMLQSLLNENPRFISAYQSLAAFQLQQGNVRAAKKVLLQGIEYAPQKIELRKMFAHVLGQTGDIKKALSILLSNAPPIVKDPEYYALMASYLEKDGQMQRAGQVYRALVDIEPENSTYWLGYAVALESMNRLNEALKAYAKVLDGYDTKPVLQAYAAERVKVLKG
jgi:tetratricopeptide (TPR) repeat protein